jgi:hypothetical protein
VDWGCGDAGIFEQNQELVWCRPESAWYVLVCDQKSCRLSPKVANILAFGALGICATGIGWDDWRLDGWNDVNRDG